MIGDKQLITAGKGEQIYNNAMISLQTWLNKLSLKKTNDLNHDFKASNLSKQKNK